METYLKVVIALVGLLCLPVSFGGTVICLILYTAIACRDK